MYEVEFEQLPHMFAREMCRRPCSGRSEAELSRTGADEVYKRLNRLRRHRVIDKQHGSRADSEVTDSKSLTGPSYPPAQTALSCAPAAPDRLAPKQSATRSAARQRPRPDAGPVYGGEVS